MTTTDPLPEIRRQFLAYLEDCRLRVAIADTRLARNHELREIARLLSE